MSVSTWLNKKANKQQKSGLHIKAASVVFWTYLPTMALIRQTQSSRNLDTTLSYMNYK